MAHTGKIGFHFPARGNPNLDTYDIKFLPAGHTASTINDLQQINKVYAIPAGVTISNITDLQNYVVWELSSKILVAGTEEVAIQYKPSTNIAVTDIGIFCSQSTGNRTAHVKIFHDSGLCVAAIDGDIITTGQTLYELSGSKHDTVINSTTLYAGQTYYIIYSNGYTNYFPAYFDGLQGNYKVYNNQETASQTTIYDVSPNATTFKTGLYRGTLSDTSGIVGMPENSWFTWIGSTQIGMSQGHIYKRTSIGTQYNFVGIVGDPSNYHTITSTDLSSVIGKPMDSEFIWYVNDYPNMTKGDIYAKVSGTWSLPELVDLSTASDMSQGLAMLLITLQTQPAMISDGNFMYNTRIGYTIKLKSGYTSKVTSTTPETSLPSNPSDGNIYYLSGSIGQEVGYQTGCFVYNGGSYTMINQNNYTTYLDEEPLSDLLTRVGSNSDLLTDENNGHYNFATATVETTKKFYLSINGNEV